MRASVVARPSRLVDLGLLAGTIVSVQRWNLLEISTPGGTRSPVVLHSDDDVARAVLIGLEPGQELGDHQVKEHAFLVVVEGSVRVEAAGEAAEAGPGTLFFFEPDERHAVSSGRGARILLLLAPWPGAGHYRGGGAERGLERTAG
jgi:quercetin dioxygenase-like cupin family protein